MSNLQVIERWFDRFPALRRLQPQHLQMARDVVQFPVLQAGAVAYRQDWECPNYLMCLDGLTRVFKVSESGREILIYKVGGGGTCLLTTQCLLSGGNFPAESTAEQRTELAAIPADTFRHLMRESSEFRDFVLDDYAKLMSSMFNLVDDLAFGSLEQRLARRLIAEADREGIINKTHQQLAADLGSVREVISRYLGEWERSGVISIQRGQMRILDREALAGQRAN